MKILAVLVVSFLATACAQLTALSAIDLIPPDMPTDSTSPFLTQVDIAGKYTIDSSAPILREVAIVAIDGAITPAGSVTAIVPANGRLAEIPSKPIFANFYRFAVNNGTNYANNNQFTYIAPDENDIPDGSIVYRVAYIRNNTTISNTPPGGVLVPLLRHVKIRKSGNQLLSSDVFVDINDAFAAPISTVTRPFATKVSD
ncbi:MAG: hypothetical protein ACRCY4_10565 [Brevinema sp.]